MTLLCSLFALLGPMLLLACGLISGRWVNRWPQAMRTASVWLTGVTFVSAMAAAACVVNAGVISEVLLQTGHFGGLGFGVYIDGLSVSMMLLISFIGWVIAKFSVRYLDGEATQGRFTKWINFTLGAVLLLVISRNLIMFSVAWILTSFGLHQLLTHYGERHWALIAARKKFLISRIGDLFLIAALGLTYWSFGSFEYDSLFASAATLQSDSASPEWLIALTALLYVFVAVTKSAQFPFHTWLPDTMETPTPVSALMHAGIINAGGFLILRLSPLVNGSQLALTVLAAIGLTTALLGAIVMLTQTSIKRSLAYSTIAQMGFMMLQCGLGAYAAALLHIVAHSLYKAHAFLSSGSVLDTYPRVNATEPDGNSRRTMLTLLGALTAAVLVIGLVGSGFKLMGATESKSVAMLLVLSIALTQLLWTSFQLPSRALASRGLLIAAVVAVAYFSLHALSSKVLLNVVPTPANSSPVLSLALAAVVAVGFFGLLGVQTIVPRFSQSRWAKRLYVQASNGFYFDIPAQKLVLRLWGK